MGKVIRDIRLTGHRFFMQWDITSQCNFSCSHCYNSETGDDLSYADLINILNQYKDFLKELSKQQRSNYNHVLGLSGGEPFMRSDFFDLIEELHNQQIKYLILTNGYHIDENNVKDLEKFRPSRVQISIDGIEATHDSIRGSGSFAKAVDSVGLLRQYNIPVVISFTATNTNYAEFPDVVTIAKNARANGVWTDRVVGITPGTESLELNETETEAYVNLVEQERSLAQQQKSTTAVMYHRALQFLETGRSAYKCSAAERNFAILYNGDMIPCRRMPIVVGNVLQDTISELFFNNSTIQDLRTFQVSTGCENCNHKNTCNGGLKCLAYRNFADYRKADPGCWLAE